MTVHALADWLTLAGNVSNILTLPAIGLHYWASKRHRHAEHQRTRLVAANAPRQRPIREEAAR